MNDLRHDPFTRDSEEANPVEVDATPTPSKTTAGWLSASLIQARYGRRAHAPAPEAPAEEASAEEARPAPPIQAAGSLDGNVRAHAAQGLQGGGGPLPYQDLIQASFGHHDVSGIKSHTGGAAARASAAMGARAFTMGDHVAFDGQPDLHTAAHEAAHTVQQQSGVQLAGGVGRAGDAYEQQADAVADRVVEGESAEALLDQQPQQSGAQPGQGTTLGNDADISSFVDGVVDQDEDEDEEKEKESTEGDSKDRADVEALETATVEADATPIQLKPAASAVALERCINQVQRMIMLYLSGQVSAADHRHVVSTWSQCRGVVSRIKANFPRALGRVVKIFDHCMANDYSIVVLLRGLEHLERNLQGTRISRKRMQAALDTATSLDLHRAVQGSGNGVPKLSAMPAHLRRNPRFVARFHAYVAWRARHYDQFSFYLGLLEQRGYQLAGSCRAQPVLVHLQLDDRSVHSGTFEHSHTKLKSLLAGADPRLILDPRSYVKQFIANSWGQRIDSASEKALKLYANGMGGLHDRWPSTSYVAQCFSLNEEIAKRFDPDSAEMNHYGSTVVLAHQAYLRSAGRESMGHAAFESLIETTGKQIRAMLAFARAKHNTSFGQGTQETGTVVKAGAMGIHDWLIRQQANSECLLSCWS